MYSMLVDSWNFKASNSLDCLMFTRNILLVPFWVCSQTSRKIRYFPRSQKNGGLPTKALYPPNLLPKEYQLPNQPPSFFENRQDENYPFWWVKTSVPKWIKWKKDRSKGWSSSQEDQWNWYLKFKIDSTPKGRLVKGPYKPICRDCAIYFSITAYGTYIYTPDVYQFAPEIHHPTKKKLLFPNHVFVKGKLKNH